MIDKFEKFSFAISEISRCWHKITAKEMREYGLKGTYSLYFTTLYQHPEGITAVKLAEICGKDKSDVSRAVSVLEKEGFIIKNGNNYRALIKLSSKGNSLAEKINHKVSLAVEYVGKDLNEENRKIFYESLDLIVSNLQNLSKDGLSGE